MDFIDDIHLVFSDLRRDPHLVDQVPDIIHRVVGGGIKLMDVERSGPVERQAGFAFVAGFYLIDRVEAIDRFGQDTWHRWFCPHPWARRTGKPVPAGCCGWRFLRSK